MLVAFLWTDTVIEPSSCLVALVSRKAMEPSDSISDCKFDARVDGVGM